MDDDKQRANPGFAHAQLARALQTAEHGDFSELRARAKTRVGQWAEVFLGMLQGTLGIGSRTPAAGIPAWATLRVLHGGFATQELLAGGPLLPHEKARLLSLGLPESAGRTALNASYLTEDGIAELQALLDSARYRVEFPEEGALLVVAWLLRHDRAPAARALLDELGPFFDRVRFYPAPHATALRVTDSVRVQDVADTLRQLGSVKDRVDTQAFRESVEVWTPLYDRLVALFAETTRDGWPCQSYPPGWKERAQALLAQIEAARARHPRCRWPHSPGHNFYRLAEVAQRASHDPAALTGADVGRVRSILSAIETKRGLPSSEPALKLRAEQARQAALPSRREVAQTLTQRLASHAPDEGLANSAEWIAPVRGRELDEKMRRRVLRAVEATVEQHLAQGTIGSPEVLARVIPRLSGAARASSIRDPGLRVLYGALYEAFRRRRSVLLLNLESQVKLAELPWVRAVEDLRTAPEGERQASTALLRSLVAATVTHFPAVPFPNKLLQEFKALAQSAQLELPIVEELAADIFMGDFTAKFLDASKRAASLLEGTLYERYYQIPFARLRALDDVVTVRDRLQTSAGFRALCFERADALGRGGARTIAGNGMVIEQAQVLTTHNLATLVGGLDVEVESEACARACVLWILRRLKTASRQPGARWANARVSGFAWRQLVYFLARLPEATQRGFVAWARAQRDADRLAPALDGLEAAVVGGTRTAAPFIGWSVQPHWLVKA